MQAFNEKTLETFNKFLVDSVTNSGSISTVLGKAIMYTVQAGGKRFRPMLHIITGESLGLSVDALLPTAAAVELIHTYSLIHDDLPALDNDELRRGQPTCHVVFGEDTAIMAGDALFAEAFRVLLQNNALQPKKVLRIARGLADVTGPNGMVGGQMLDLKIDVLCADEDTLYLIDKNKTAKLISFSVFSAGIAAGIPQEEIEILEKFGTGLGVAFQIMDDILDVEGDTGTIGKSVGKDKASGKPNFVQKLGTSKARDVAKEEIDKAVAYLDDLDHDFTRLKQISNFVLSRNS